MRALIAAFAIALTIPASAGPQEAKLARDAFYAIEAEPFSEGIIKAANDMQAAMRTAEDEPWVLIVRSRAVLEAGAIGPEAIEQYRKALAIRPYPLAEEQLRQTILLRDAAKR